MKKRSRSLDENLRQNNQLYNETEESAETRVEITVTSEKKTSDKKPVEKRNSEVGYKKTSEAEEAEEKIEVEEAKLEADDKDNGEKLKTKGESPK
ncbi:hypothetical protein TNCV_4277591 [Trichonephila clavipes]|nr:hypothetical protein TNCV_4277591 [Trichonephila clavipes]